MRTWSYSNSVGQSVALHVTLVLTCLAITFRPQGASSLRGVDDVPFEVIEAPRVAAMPLEAKSKSQLPKTKQPRSVFGLSRKAITSNDTQAPEAKPGNTLAKSPDDLRLKDSDLDSLPIPTDDYLVSQMPVLISDFRIAYPEDAKKASIQGAVLMELLIDDQGRVRQAQVIQPLFPSLDSAALEAARKLLFKPARVSEKMVAVRIRYAYRFVLE